MNPDEIQKKLIIDIFNEMDFDDPRNTNDSSVTTGEIFDKEMQFSYKSLEILTKEPKSMDQAIEAAVKAQNIWKSLPALQRASFMHKIWKFLKKISMLLSKSKNDFLILVDYFDLNSDLAVQIDEYKNWKPYEVVLVILSSCSPFLILGATIAPALATGCSMIVVAPENSKIAALVLKEAFAESGLPEGLLNVVTDISEVNTSDLKKIDKVFFCGSYSAASSFYLEHPVKSFNFFSPNNTTALILESSDLNAAADKIVKETWGVNSYFAVSKVVVQESILTNFLEVLKYQIEQFMTENKNSTKFKDNSIAENINKTIMKAEKAGASIIKCSQYNNKWSPTVLLNYQSQDIIDDVPILRILPCRSAKEGITLLNNFKHNFGTSVWSEISSQNLEVSSMLMSPNIWINCHGVAEASEPIQLTGFNGNCTLGGSDGIFEYLSFKLSDSSDKVKSNDSEEFNTNKLEILQTALKAHQAFNSWQNNKSRRQYLKELANTLQDHEDLSKLSIIVNNYAHLGNLINYSEKNGAHKFVTVKRKVPIGVIVIVITNSIVDLNTLITLITLPIALGNAVIFVQKEKQPLLEIMVRHFINNLPKYLVSVIFGQEAVIHLASDPSIQAIWLYNEPTVSSEFLQTIKTHTECLKRIWVIPRNVPFSQQLFQKECLKNEVIWQTKVDQFPQGN